MILMNAEQARRIYQILIDYAGVANEEEDIYSFVFHTAESHKPAEEYRLMSGNLGFGGKFRNNFNKILPFVDCYPEDINPERQFIINKVNSEIQKVFK